LREFSKREKWYLINESCKYYPYVPLFLFWRASSVAVSFLPRVIIGAVSLFFFLFIDFREFSKREKWYLINEPCKYYPFVPLFLFWRASSIAVSLLPLVTIGDVSLVFPFLQFENIFKERKMVPFFPCSNFKCTGISSYPSAEAP